MIDFFSILKWKGFPVKEALAIWDDIDPQLNGETYQQQRKWEAVRYHVSSNKAYANFITSVPERWESVPIINKDIMRQFGLEDDRNLDGHLKYYRSSTSGSTGKPFRFAKDYLTHALTWVHVAKCYGLVDVSLNDLQARFYGAPTTQLAKYIEKTKDFIGHRQRFPVLDLSDVALEHWIGLFKAKPFVYMYGYSYPIITFAKYLLKTNRVLKQLVPSLKACILTAEMCEANERQLVAQALGVPVCNEYGASEFGILGFAVGPNWEIANGLLMVEILDDNGCVLPNGSLGNVTVTSLFNKGTPFIRYQTGDLGALDMVDGKQVLTQLYGRREDMAQLPSGKRTPGDTAFYYVFKDFSSRYDVITEYKVVQTSSTVFEIRYTSLRELTTDEKTFLLKLCEAALERNIDFKLLRLNVLDRTRMGKFRRFVSEVPN